MMIGAPLDFDDLLSSLTDESAFIFWLPTSSKTRDDDDGTKQAKIAENRAMVLNFFFLSSLTALKYVAVELELKAEQRRKQSNIGDEFC